MADKYWLGTAPAVAQVDTVTITGFDGATTYQVTIGGETVSVTGDTDANTTAANLQAALAAATSPYFTAITCTASTNVVTATATVPGVPFSLSSSTSVGTGAISDSSVTASAGPAHWDTAANWSDGTVPATNDKVVIRDTENSILWGLDQSSVTLTELVVDQSFTGYIGLDYRSFATSSEGDRDESKTEYRDVYLDIAATTVHIGDAPGPGSHSGSPRLLLDLGATQTTVIVHGTSTVSAETGRPAVRLLMSHSSNQAYVRFAPGGVGIAAEIPGETSTLSALAVSDTTDASRVVIGEGTTITSFSQTGGQNRLSAAATVTTVTVDGGSLTTEGAYKVTTVHLDSGLIYLNNLDGSSIAATTVNLNAGELDTQQSAVPRTISTLNLARAGATLRSDQDIVTFTTFNLPSSRQFVLKATEPPRS